MSFLSASLARVCALTASLAATLTLTGCESSSFRFGGRPVTVRVLVPVGVTPSASLCVDDELCRPMFLEGGEPDEFEFSGAVEASADGAFDCEFLGGHVEITGPGCEAQLRSFGAQEAPDSQPIELVVELTCDLSALGPEPGRPCESDAVCGGQGHTCQPESGTCVPPSCAFAEDCADAALICEPSTATCELGGCDCSGAEVCIWQTTEQGRCAPRCTPHLDETCPSNTVCQTLSESLGFCAPHGAAPLGADCSPSDVSTGCQAGLVCSDALAGRCLQPCDLFAAAPGCSDGERCVAELRWGYPPHTGFILGACRPVGELPVDPAAIGESCAMGHASCGDDGVAVRGGCDGDRVCRPLCRFEPDDCDDGLACASVPSLEGFGLCG